MSPLREKRPGARIRVGLDYGLYAGERLPVGDMVIASGVDESLVLDGHGTRGIVRGDGLLCYRDGSVGTQGTKEDAALPRVGDAGWALYR